jgi:hypothetical protein
MCVFFQACKSRNNHSLEFQKWYSCSFKEQKKKKRQRNNFTTLWNKLQVSKISKEKNADTWVQCVPGLGTLHLRDWPWGVRALFRTMPHTWAPHGHILQDNGAPMTHHSGSSPARRAHHSTSQCPDRCSIAKLGKLTTGCWWYYYWLVCYRSVLVGVTVVEVECAFCLPFLFKLFS